MPLPTSICRRRTLDDLVADLGSVDHAICIVRTFAAGLDARVGAIIDSLDGSCLRGTALVRDLRAAALTVGACGLADWCRGVLDEPELPVETLEIIILAAQTEVWLDGWLAEREDGR